MRRLILIVVALGIILLGGLVVVKAWEGDPADPHVLMGHQLMERSLLNRLMK